jgi:hypothetical protein
MPTFRTQPTTATKLILGLFYPSIHVPCFARVEVGGVEGGWLAWLRGLNLLVIISVEARIGWGIGLKYSKLE